MAPRVSIRISLRWLPDTASEPTDTLVFGVGAYYLDLRVLKSNNSIDWALAGERQVISTDPSKLSYLSLPTWPKFNANQMVSTVVKVRFNKTLDSLNMTEPDEGDFTKLPNGDDFETGKMPCPERGMQVTEYEEVWRQILPVPGPRRAWILESAGEGRKVFLGRIGGGFIAIGDKKGATFGARREEWDKGRKSWEVKYKIGDVENVPSVADLGAEGFEGEADWKMGDTVNVLGRGYLVRAFELFE
jgi:hypothetical protein